MDPGSESVSWDRLVEKRLEERQALAKIKVHQEDFWPNIKQYILHGNRSDTETSRPRPVCAVCCIRPLRVQGLDPREGVPVEEYEGADFYSLNQRYHRSPVSEDMAILSCGHVVGDSCLKHVLRVTREEEGRADVPSAARFRFGAPA
ncbi:hypothetical protein QBC46DRAFT_388118 [Diplogelasinospora grovesii]|uniref:Uncharacterized protein n=1 Tax=Diplogelasinospora grovesii TaxID=303347 RepID=A0AAN6N5X7_9PEZI|nr:hypothetical protein QBC46DRAFT_388118 [Diplogelasinospora grovesii]